MADAYGVGMGSEHDRHCLGRRQRGSCLGRRRSEDEVAPRADEFCREVRHVAGRLRPAELEFQVSAFDITQLAQPGPESLYTRRKAGGGSGAKIAHARNRRSLLRKYEVWRRERARKVGYCFGIRSERRLCEEVHLNLAYRWFCRLGLERAVPDHSTFSKNRHGRFRDSDLFRRLFEVTVKRCIDEGLVGGDGFAVDASLIRAEASRQHFHPGEEGLPRNLASRAIDEYVAVLDDAAFGAATPVVPARLSSTDPAARYTSAHGGQAQFCYATNYLVYVANAVIIDVEASTAVRQAELNAAKRMIERAHDDLGLWPRKLIADTGYAQRR